ncbi:Nhe2 [Bugula neritina]|uniref:Nhe2 n=1 Tax=Bugula neritina TaxID=10212 RepID=A0A7J7IVI1_BUGNE|nr:Nhe2 [Bugula neritina]
MMAAVEDITGYRGNHTLRDKWEYYDNKYLKKFLLREKQMTKEHSIMRTHSKLSLKDAMHTMHSGFSTANMPANNGQSLLRLISNWSVNSFHDQENDLELRQRMSSQGGSEADVHHNDTVVDLQALDAHFSKKIADDTKTHHLLEENLIAPRAKLAGLKHHQRHTIHEDDVDESHHNSAYYHHNARLHLRHMISKHQHNLQERKKQKAQAKLDKNHRLPKNVSFANIASPNNQAGNGTHANIQGDDNSDDEMGIQFTAKSESDRDLNGVFPTYIYALTYHFIIKVAIVKELMSPVALECQLPWKRNACPQESEPVCSMATHLLPDDTTPELSQIPSWADNLDYNHIPAVSPRASTHTDAPTQMTN